MSTRSCLDLRAALAFPGTGEWSLGSRVSVVMQQNAVDSALRLGYSHTMSSLALTELLGSPVFDTAGSQCGRVREVALAPQEDSSRVAMFVVRTKAGDRLLPLAAVGSVNGGIYAVTSSANWSPVNGAEGLFLLERDLLDQQIIDVHGRKVVRVNDVDLHQETSNNRPVLRVGA